VIISADITTSLGSINKQVIIISDLTKVDICYHLDWPKTGPGSLRLGHITLNPQTFFEESLLYCTHNGGDHLETYRFNNKKITQGDSVSFLVSAQTGLGLTKGEIILGDSKQQLCIKISQDLASTIGIITYRQVGSSYFYRLAFSGREMDETNCKTEKKEAPLLNKFAYTITLAGLDND